MARGDPEEKGEDRPLPDNMRGGLSAAELKDGDRQILDRVVHGARREGIQDGKRLLHDGAGEMRDPQRGDK